MDGESGVATDGCGSIDHLRCVAHVADDPVVDDIGRARMGAGKPVDVPQDETRCRGESTSTTGVISVTGRA